MRKRISIFEYQKAMDKIIKRKISVDKKLQQMLNYDRKIITYYEPKNNA